MNSDPKVNQQLNRILSNELTAINQYFLHARMFANWGLETLNNHEYKTSIKAMKQADALIERILFLQGLPNLQVLDKLLIGEETEEMLKGDLQLERQTHSELLEAIEYCESVKDYVSRELLNSILESKEEQIDWLETQHELIKSIGIANYQQSAM